MNPQHPVHFFFLFITISNDHLQDSYTLKADISHCLIYNHHFGVKYL